MTSAVAPASEAPGARVKRLALRSMRRGTKEMDLILTAYSRPRLGQMTAEEMDAYEALLAEADPDIYDWVAGRTAPPEAHAPLVDDIRKVAEGLTRPR